MLTRSPTRFGLRRQAVKPRGARQVINWGHPLTRDLRVYVPFTEGRGLARELVSQSYPDGTITYVENLTPGQSSWADVFPGDTPVRYRPLWFATVTALNNGLQWSDAQVGLANVDEGLNSQFTVAMIVTPTSLGGGAGPHWFSKHDGTNGWSLGLQGGNIPGFQCASALNAAVTQTAALVNRPYAIIGRVRFPDMDVRAIDILTGAVETGTDVWGFGTPAPVSGQPLRIGIRTSSTQSRAAFAAASMWKRALSDSEIDEWLDNPWALLAEQGTRRWFLPAAAPVTNVNVTPPAGALLFTGYPPVVQETVVPAGIASAEAFGVHALVDVATTISPSGIASAEAFGGHELVDGIGAAGTIDLDTGTNGIASGEAVGSHSVTETAIIRPTGIPSAFDMDLHDVGVAVGTIAPFGIASEEAFSQVGTGGGINGGHTVVTPTNPPASSGTVTAKKLCAPVGLLRAELIDTALDQAVILPDVYGDFSVGGLRGPCPAVLVNDASPFIYIAAAHPVKEITNVYVDDVEQTSGFATVTAVDLGAGFQVAVIAFSTQPTGQVSWRGKGRMDDSLALIENPIEQLETLLKHRNSWSTEDFDATTLAEAKAVATAEGWTTAFVFADDRQVQDWITEVLFNVMGFWRISGRAQLQVTLDPGGSTFPQSDLVDSIVASRDCEDGDDGVTFVADRQHLVNKLEAYYLYSWSLNQPSSRLIDLEDALSINAHGELRKSVTLRGLRSAVQVQAWAAILFERQGFAHRVEGAVVQFRVKGSRLIHATVGDLLAFTWPYGPTREFGHAYVNEILRILAIRHDYATGGIVTVTAIDTGAYVQSGGTRLLTPLAL